MRRLSPEQWAFCGVLLAALGYAGYRLAGMSRRNADLTAPPRQPSPESYDALARLGFLAAVDGHSVVCQPEDHHHGYVYTPHRFPRTVGGEITSAIHHGFSSMRVPNVQDVQWIIAPPSEAAW